MRESESGYREEELFRAIFGEDDSDPEPSPTPGWVTEENAVIKPHSWKWCGICGWHMKCGFCGNNCCNGGSGRTAYGKDCDCDEAYALLDAGWEKYRQSS